MLERQSQSGAGSDTTSTSGEHQGPSGNALDDAGNAALTRMIVQAPDDLNQRSQPHLGHNVVGHIAPGTTVEVEGQAQHGFIEVKDPKTHVVGWVSKRYLHADGHADTKDHHEIRKALPVEDHSKSGPVDPKQPVSKNIPVSANPERTPEFANSGERKQTSNDTKLEHITPEDVRQGKLGDCYLLSALTAACRANPKIIQDLIKPVSGNPHAFDVTLYEHKQPHVIRVTDDFVKGDMFDTAYAHEHNGEIWPLLLEKAYAVLKGSYNVVTKGGDGLTGFNAILPKGAEEHPVHDAKSPISEIMQSIRTAVASKKPVTAGTINVKEHPEAGKLFSQTGIMDAHAYSVINVDDNYIYLHNPHGFHDKPLTHENFHALYSWYAVGHV